MIGIIISVIVILTLLAVAGYFAYKSMKDTNVCRQNMYIGSYTAKDGKMRLNIIPASYNKVNSTSNVKLTNLVFDDAQFNVLNNQTFPVNFDTSVKGFVALVVPLPASMKSVYKYGQCTGIANYI